MSHVIVVETDNQQHIHKVTLAEGKPVVVGRSWQNDVIINDQYVDASHLELTVDKTGNLSVSDLGTKNGSRLRKRKLTGLVPYEIGSKIAIGESTIALHEIDSVVAPAMKHDRVHAVDRSFGSFPWVILASLAACGGALISIYWSNSEEATSEMLATLFLGLGLLTLGWSLLGGVVGKLFRKKTFIKLHWILFCSALAFASVLALIVDIVRFNLDTDVASASLQHGFIIVCVMGLAYGVLSLSTRLSRSTKVGTAGFLAMLPTVFSLITPLLAQDHEKWSYAAYVDRIDQPPALLFRKPTSIDKHFESTRNLFAELDAEVGNTSQNPPSIHPDELSDAPIKLSETND